jgi:hypothetical protein
LYGGVNVLWSAVKKMVCGTGLMRAMTKHEHRLAVEAQGSETKEHAGGRFRRPWRLVRVRGQFANAYRQRGRIQDVVHPETEESKRMAAAAL